MTEINLPTAADVRDAMVCARLEQHRPSPVETDHETGRRASTAQAVSLMRARAAEDADSLDLFAETIAELFGCPKLTAAGVRMQIKQAHDEIRHLAQRLGIVAPKTPAAAGRQRARTPRDG